MQETWVLSLGQEDPLEKEMAAHSSILARKIPMDRGAWLGYSPWGHKEWESSVQFSSVQSLNHVQLFGTP